MLLIPMDPTLDALQSEVEFYRQNQTAVEQEIRTLIADNQKLSQQVGALLKEKLENAKQPQPQKCDQNKELEELNRQILLLTKERDSLHVLWQTSQKTIDALETELKTYHNYGNRGGQHINEEKRELKLKLETALTDYIELETKYKELHKKHNELENNLNIKEKEINYYKERGKQLEDKVDEITKTLDEYKLNCVIDKKCNEDLKKQLSLSQKENNEKIKKEIEAKAKVAEALQLFDLVSEQKKEAYKRVKEISEQLITLKQTLANVSYDIESNYKKELDDIKEKYNEKIVDMLEHIKNLDAEIVEKGLLLNKTLRENKILQAANENYLKQQKECDDTVDPKLTLAEQRLEAMFQELVTSERRNIQLVCEKQCLAIDIQRVQDIHTRERKRRDWEESLLKTQCEELKMQVGHLQKSLDETHGMINKLQSMLSSRTELNQKMVSTKEEELMELNKHLENQMELSKKWKESYVEMTEKMKKKLEQLQIENSELKSKLLLPQSESQDNASTSS
ncbi:putative leucine-rich repeat-containing protein DDB_G0290503 [Galleria mellonella]|uniref:Leucine-rich repeat-containing protein DDB_G0290503 n=1 Tax=Galleria mellonella TaxID=7137 RepID=A0A6J3BZI2_GALME|nr:putative leucine-rich repeat-containing protein DDB_G0290503 [Galleria mellonella]